MTKKILIAVIIVAIAIAGYYIYKNTSKSVPEPVSTETIRVPLDLSKPSETKQLGTSKTLLFTSGTAAISFEGSIAQARNPGSNVYLNNIKIGEVEGWGIVMGSFSSDNKYFAFKTVSICGAGCEDYNLHLIDLDNKVMLNVFPPRKEADFGGDTSNYQDEIVRPFIESYEWNQPDLLNVVTYFIGQDKENAKTYRVSHKEEWSYNLNSKTYTFIQALPE